MDSIEVSTSQGTNLYVRVRSGRPTVLFLHGLAGHGGEWTPVIGHLPDSVGVIAPDQRAHGASWDGTNGEIDRMSFVDDAVALVEALTDGPVVLVGQSMGGIVATLVTHARPDLIGHLVLVEAGVDPMTEADFDALKAWLDRWPASFADIEEASEFFGSDSRSTPAWVEGRARTPAGLVRRFDPDAMLRVMRVLAGTSRYTEWQQILVPTTLIRAANSMITDRDIADMLAARPDVELVTIEDCGHDVHLDQAARVAAVLTPRL